MKIMTLLAIGTAVILGGCSGKTQLQDSYTLPLEGVGAVAPNVTTNDGFASVSIDGARVSWTCCTGYVAFQTDLPVGVEYSVEVENAFRVAWIADSGEMLINGESDGPVTAFAVNHVVNGSAESTAIICAPST